MINSSSTTANFTPYEDADTPGDISDEDESAEEGDSSDADHLDEVEEEEDDAGVETVLSKPKIPSNIPKRGNVNIPRLIVYNQLTFDCPYLESCHVLSSILSTTRIIGLTPPEELRETAIQVISVEGYQDKHYPQINKDSLNKHIDIILQVDPHMYCWTNFHISYLYSHWVVIGGNAVLNLSQDQKKLRSKAWYYVIIFLCRLIPKYPELLKSKYLLSMVQCILNISEVKLFAKLMTTQKLDEPEGIDTEHWVKLQVCITAYSKDDNDPSGTMIGNLLCSFFMTWAKSKDLP